MSWVRKKRGPGAYFYVSQRLGGRVVQVYYGRGPAVEFLADQLAEVRALRRTLMQAVRSQHEQMIADTKALKHLGIVSRLLASSQMARVGYHWHRGAWRRRMVKKNTAPATPDQPSPAKRRSKQAALPTRPSNAQLAALLESLNQRVRRDDPTALAELRRLLDQHPEIVAHYGNLARHTQTHWLAKLAEGDAVHVECLTRNVAALRNQLISEEAPAEEQLLVDQILASHVAASAATKAAASATPASLAGSYMRQAESARRQMLASIRLLKDMREKSGVGMRIPTLKAFVPDASTG